MRYLSPNRDIDFLASTLSDPEKEDLKTGWHKLIADQVDDIVAAPTYAHFLDPLQADKTAIRKAISWQGFPRAFDGILDVEGEGTVEEIKQRCERAHRSADNLYQFVYLRLNGRVTQWPFDPNGKIALYPDSFGKPDHTKGFSLLQRPQDEYLEWFAVRDAKSGKTVRLDFTSEAPEYWDYLAKNDDKTLVALYSKIHGVDVPRADLYFATDIYCLDVTAKNGQGKIIGHHIVFKKGEYNPYNKWNTKYGAIHLTQRANSLGAEINLAADATIKWPERPTLNTKTDRFKLLACAKYGGINRNSDPTIGFEVNSLSLGGNKVSISNPIGLFIGEINLDGFRDPLGKKVAREKILTIQRGSESDEDALARVLRFSVHPPVGASYGLEECTFNSFNLDSGSPIARETSVVIHGIAMATDAAQPAGQALGKACKHPTLMPDFYAVVEPADGCPGPDFKWDSLLEAPLVPESELKMTDVVLDLTAERVALTNWRL